MKPTRWQYFLGSLWAQIIWRLGWAAIVVGYIIWSLKPTLADWVNPWFLLPVSAVTVVGFCIGWVAAIIPGVIVFPPLLALQGRLNGGPFELGERVYVIAGEHRGKISTVYSISHEGAVRVYLGEAAKVDYSDIFEGFQLLLVDPNGPSAAEDTFS